jgi:RNA polymerase sigma factor (TIGR02999 family)
MRLAKVEQMSTTTRAHFLAMTARLMRQILVDHARRKRSVKRGRDARSVALSEGMAVGKPMTVDILALDEALVELATFDPRQRDLIELRYFAGLTIEEAAEALNISPATVEREWAVARAWLYEKLSPRR